MVLCGQNSSKERCDILMAGASACLTKPIDLRECAAQVEALLNLYFAKSKERAIRTIAFGTGFVIDPDFRTVFLKGKLIKLSRREFDLLFFLASHDKQVFSRQQLYEQVWGYEPSFSVDEAVKSCITEWDEDMIRQLVDTVKVLSTDRIRVCLRGGMEIEQTIEGGR